MCGIHQQLLSDDSNFGCFLLRSIDLSEFMRLDAAASTALHLEPSPGESGGRYSSLYGLLNQCQTPQGQRLLRQWIKQPLLDHRRIGVCLSVPTQQQQHFTCLLASYPSFLPLVSPSLLHFFPASLPFIVFALSSPLLSSSLSIKPKPSHNLQQKSG